MRQIERYILGRIAALTFWSLTSITILALTTQILIRVDVLTTSSSAIWTFGSLAVTLIPQVALVVAPFALLVGIARVFATMNDDSELVVIEASGASGRTAVMPVMVFSIFVGICMLLVSNFVGPMAKRNLYSIISEANSDILSIAVSSGTFQRIEKDLFVQVGESLPGGVMSSIFLTDRRDPKAEMTYYAKTGSILNYENNDLLIMNDGEVHRSNLENKDVSIIKFESYALDLNSFIPSSSTQWLRPNELYLPDLFKPDESNPDFKFLQRLYPYEIHSRLSSWLYPIAFGIIVVAFLGRAQSHRGEQIQRIAAAGLICVLIRVGGGIALENSHALPVAATLSYTLPIAAGLYFALRIVRDKPVGLPRFWRRGFDRTARILRKIMSLRLFGTSQHKRSGANL